MRIEAIFCWTRGSNDGFWDVETIDIDQDYIDKAGGNIHDALQWWVADQEDMPNLINLAYVGVYNDKPLTWYEYDS